MEACLDRPSVNTVLLDNFDDLFEVFEALTARHEVVCRITNEDRIIFAAYTMDLINDVGVGKYLLQHLLHRTRQYDGWSTWR